MSARRGVSALTVTVTSWFAVAMVGQWAFFYYLVAFYGPPTLTGHFAAWKHNTALRMSYVPGDTVGNLAFASHALLAAVIAFGGALQLIPQIRRSAMPVHRWIGRVFFVTAMGLSVSGLYMEWIRGDRENIRGGIAISINGALIVLCCVAAWRLARAHDVAAHRRWALRAYLVANAQWFTRVGVLATMMVGQGVFHAGDAIESPVNHFWDFGCYLVPLTLLELYFRAARRGTAPTRFAMAGVLAVCALLTAVGIFGIASFMWWPLVRYGHL